MLIDICDYRNPVPRCKPSTSPFLTSTVTKAFGAFRLLIRGITVIKEHHNGGRPCFHLVPHLRAGVMMVPLHRHSTLSGSRYTGLIRLWHLQEIRQLI